VSKRPVRLGNRQSSARLVVELPASGSKTSGEEECHAYLIRLAVAAAVTAVLVWLPAAAQAGITASGLD
jgi:hypothetical protein